MKKWPTTRDTLLVKLNGSDQHHAWDEFYEIYQPVVYRYGRQQGLQHTDAIELTQRVIIKVMHAAESWLETGAPDRFRSWLRTVATNTLINLVMRESKYQAQGGSGSVADRANDAPDEATWNAEAQRSIIRLAAKRIRANFTESSWAAFEMTMFDGISVSESADLLSTTPGAIYASRSRIIRALKREAEKIARSSKEATDA